MDNPDITAQITAMTPAERSARIEEIVHTSGKMSPDVCLEFTKLLFGPHVSVDHSSIEEPELA